MTGIGFFAPFPLALMIPFMAGQSLAMGEAFGKGFQYGKRKISSMTNEDFNALDFKGLSESIATDYKDMIPSMKESIRNSDVLQSAVIQEMGDLIKSIPGEILDFFAQTARSGGVTTSTSASQLGQIQTIRYGGRDIVINEEALEMLKKVQEASIITGPAGQTSRQKERQAEAKRQQQADEASRRAKKQERLVQEAAARDREAAAQRAASVVQQQRSGKRKAGQSQQQERIRLIQTIATSSAQSRRIVSNRASTAGRAHHAKQKKAALARQQVAQSALTVLLTRYWF